MKKTFAVRAGATVAALSVGLLTLGSMPAVAAGNTIAEGDALYALNCDEDYTSWQLFGVDSSTAASTPIGTGGGEGSSGCALQPAYDPSTGESYFIGSAQGRALLTMDVTTGVSTYIDGFYWNNGEFPEFIDPDSLAIGGDGSAYVLDEGRLFSVDLDTVLVEYIGETAENVYAFAWDSVTGGFFGIDYDNVLYNIDVTDGSTEVVGTLDYTDTDPESGYSTYSLQFDHEGTLWVEVDVDTEVFGGNSALFSLTFDTLSGPVYSGPFAVSGESFYNEALLIVPGEPAPVPAPEPMLAATGADLATVLPWAIAGGVVVLVGGVLLILRSRRKPAASTSPSAAPAPTSDTEPTD